MKHLFDISNLVIFMMYREKVALYTEVVSPLRIIFGPQFKISKFIHIYCSYMCVKFHQDQNFPCQLSLTSSLRKYTKVYNPFAGSRLDVRFCVSILNDRHRLSSRLFVIYEQLTCMRK